MSRRLILGIFEREEDVLEATASARAQGLCIVDVYTPYAVHGLDRALGLPPSRLSRVCLACGLLGTVLAFWLQFWTSAVSWPLNVGGRPWNSLPAFVPVAFEVMVLLAAFGVVFAFFLVSKLFPGKRAETVVAGVTTGAFVLVLEEGDAAFDVQAVRRFFDQHHAAAVEEREETPPLPAAPREPRRSRTRLNVALLVLLLALAGLNWAWSPDTSRPSLEFMPEMARSVPYDAFDANPHFPDGKTLQMPPPGTIARGQYPPPPPVPDEPRFRQRGAVLYGNYCLICHGGQGRGDGPVTLRGLQGKALGKDLLSANAVNMTDEQMFRVLTAGQNTMASYAAQLSPEDRWCVVRHVRALQKQGTERAKP